MAALRSPREFCTLHLASREDGRTSHRPVNTYPAAKQSLPACLNSASACHSLDADLLGPSAGGQKTPPLEIVHEDAVLADLRAYTSARASGRHAVRVKASREVETRRVVVVVVVIVEVVAAAVTVVR